MRSATSGTAPHPQSHAYPETARETYLNAYKQNGLEKQGACILREAERTLSYAEFKHELESEQRGRKLKTLIDVCVAETLVGRERVGAPKTIQPTNPVRRVP